MKIIKILMVFCFVVIYSLLAQFQAQELLDPRTRNEDISNTILSVDVSQNGNGHYVYQYTLFSMPENLGSISSLRIDIACEAVDLTEDFGLSIYSSDELSPIAELGSFAPVVLDSEYGSAALFRVDIRKSASWGVFQRPGETTYQSIISPFPPVQREYTLTPSFSYNSLYDYSDIDEDTPDIPWIDDFIVSGMIEAPGCSEDVVEPPSEYGVFKGSRKTKESDDENLLLTYTSPTSDHPRYSADTKSIELIIHYAENIAPQSFKALINILKASEIKKLFNPVPGTVQTIEIPLKVNNNDKTKKDIKIEFTVNAVCDEYILDGAKEKILNKCEKNGNKEFSDTDKFKLKLEKPPKAEMTTE